MTARFKVLRFKIDFVALMAAVVLLAQIVLGPLLFFVPAAVSILLGRRGLFVVLVAFGVQLVVIAPQLQALDLLMVVLSYLFGGYLWLVLRRKASFSYLVYPPLFVAFAGAFIIFMVQNKGLHFQDWTSQQLESSQLSPLPEMGQWSSAPAGEFYKEMLLPFLKKTFLAWFSFAFALIFFINAAIENIVRGRQVPTWKRFLTWRSHDLVLVGLVAGLAMTAAPLLWPTLSQDLQIWGLHLCLLVLFPILIQGSAVASFIIPRSSLFVFVLILALLLIEPLPVLLLAGFGDLWFDFRAKLKARSQ